MNINLDTAKDVLCKNVLIYGYCKYQDKGCAFSHHKSAGMQSGGSGNNHGQGQELDSQLPQSQLGQQQQQPSLQSSHHQLKSKPSRSRLQQQQQQQPQVPPPSSTASTKSIESSGGRRKFNIETPLFQPSGGGNDKLINNITSKFSNLSPTVKDAPVFRPESQSSFHDQDGNQMPPQSQQQLNNSSGLPFGTKKFNVSTPSFTPSNFDFSQGVMASGPTSSPVSQQNPPQQPQHFPSLSQGFTPNGPSSARSLGGIVQPQQPSSNPYLQNAPSPMGSASQGQMSQSSLMNSAPSMSASFFPSSQNQLHHQGPGPGPGPGGSAVSQMPPPPPQSQHQHQHQQHQQAPVYPLQYHLYAPAPPPRLSVPIKDYETNALKMFIPNDLRENSHRKNEASLQTLQHSNLPEHVNSYHSLVPIDTSYDAISKIWPGKNSLLFKCYSNTDGNLYVLRKIEPCNEVADEASFKSIKQWQTLGANANIVAIKDVFTSLAFSTISGTKVENSTALCFVYDYYPTSKTLLEHHKKSLRVEPVSEDLLWSYLVQLVNALKDIHGKGLSAGSSMEVSKIINTGGNKIRLSSCGISDVLDYGKPDKLDVEQLQRQDIKNLGKVMLDLSSLLLPVNLRSSQEEVLVRNLSNSTSLSEEFIKALQALNTVSALDDDAPGFDLKQFISDYLIDKTFSTVNSLQNSADYFESQLTSELENARLFRLLTKINFVVNTSAAGGENEVSKLSLSDANQIKVIQLFQQNLFQFFDHNGNRSINLHKVLVNLNKLDCGVDEKLLLVNENECIIVSYKEMKELIDCQFRQLKN
ncbi:PAN3 [Candida margitis]|uniref:PAN3 n=1 Tax=Candida margitis TaxID=1775924 RepID=UPI00222796B5|nr:PAN3 [Candida margitis]KAI5970348.1 PAN3 [Candida margitis]